MKDSGAYMLAGAFLFVLVGLVFENQSPIKSISIVIIFVALGLHAYLTHTRKK